MAVCMYEEHARADREAAHASYVSAPEFSALESEALSRGYRHATMSEIHSSAESAHGSTDLFCWNGGLWVLDASSK